MMHDTIMRAIRGRGMRHLIVALTVLAAGPAWAQPAAPGATGGTVPAIMAAPPADVPAAAVTPATPAPAPTDAPAAVTAGLPEGLSVSGMFTNADVIVKAVMIGLLAASVVTWTILLAKGLEIILFRRRAGREVAVADLAQHLADLELVGRNAASPMAARWRPQRRRRSPCRTAPAPKV